MAGSPRQQGCELASVSPHPRTWELPHFWLQFSLASDFTSDLVLCNPAQSSALTISDQRIYDRSSLTTLPYRRNLPSNKTKVTYLLLKHILISKKLA